MKQSNKQSLTKNILKAIAIIAAIIALLLGIVYMIKTIDDVNPSANGNIDSTKVSEEGITIDGIYYPNSKSISIDNKSGEAYVNNIVLLFFELDATKNQIDECIKSIDGQVVGKDKVINQYTIKIEQKTLSELQKICNNLNKKDCVTEAFVNYAEKSCGDTIPDDLWRQDNFFDMMFDQQDWDEDNPDGKNWWAEAINAPGAWEYELDPITIGIVDYGVFDEHEELKGIVEKPPVCYTEYDDHGTHVAGIIGAKANNGKGISGVVWNGKIKWKQIIFEPKQNEDGFVWAEYSSHVANTVQLIEKGAKVVNLSLGMTHLNSGDNSNNRFMNDESRAASLSLARLLQAGYDFTIVESAGNGDSSYTSVDARGNGMFCSIDENNCYTDGEIIASDIIDRIIVVGNAENIGNCSFQQEESSNAGDRVDICAPGTDIFSCVVNGYDCKTGTSMAAPIVTGVASLVWAANPNLSGDEVKSIVCDEKNTKYEVADNTSDKHPLKNTYRMVNAQLALEAALGIKHEDEEDYDDYVYIDDDFSRKVTLVLDASASMNGTPMEQTKNAARKFVKQMLKIDDVKISIVAYSDYAEVLTDFTSNRITLMGAIDNLEPIDDTNIEDGLYLADEMLNENSADKNIIVLMSDGQPNQGLVDEDLIDYANELKDSGDIIYTLGFFSDVDDLWYSQYLMEQIATPGFHYEVDDGNNLKFFFGDLAEQIKGAKYIYIRIACPVDVTVTDGKEILSSTEGEYNTRTKFGNLGFEYNEDSDDETKVLRLREGDSYDVNIQGYDEGFMDYTIEFMDDEGNYSDTRNFYGLEVNENTIVDTVAEPSKKTRLKVDNDGDGKYETTFVAEANQDGVIEKNLWIPIIVILVIISALVVVLYAYRRKIFNSSGRNKVRRER